MADTTAEAPEFCEDCISGHLKSGTPTGTEIKLGDVDTYIAMPEAKEPVAAVLIVADVFGWKLVNTRLIADEFAKEGFLAILPDLFKGDAVDADALLFPPGVFKKIKRGLSTTASMVKLLVNHTKATTMLLLDSVLKGLHEKYPSVKKIGALGYCWGGKYAIILGSQPEEIAAVATAHPSFVKLDEVEAITVPSLWCCAEKDAVFTEKLRKQSEEARAKKVELESTFKIYEGTSHGFAVRCDEKDVTSQKAATEALNEMKAFYSKHLAV
ncbi:dienelactone hydrolase [Endogone sp. FLAS-F59071]|nr:dienelactone hydrolase [Endogone sp. FLAS-F59071]|eukprot:RUS17008.1 dienelactone hydrolase [Endogone sp. FLAS-F59071]